MPRMCGSKSLRLRVGFLRLARQQVPETCASTRLFLARSIERIVAIVLWSNRALRHQEKRDDTRPGSSDEDRDPAAHAVADQAALDAARHHRISVTIV